ncbi:MAG: ATP-binding protein [Oscillospiraceae bacterium]|nr:ATP-binding protein [Oscillospiraceae bacterium]
MENKPKIYMICGISGSGKTALSKEMELFGIPRLSIDEELWPDFYVLADMMSTEHRDYLYSEAMKRIKARTANFCAENRSCSVDMPFCKKAQREDFRAHIEKSGGEAVLIWIDTPLEVLKKRLLERKDKNGPNNLPVSEEEIGMYWRGFQRPEDENAIRIDGTKPFEMKNIIK